MRVLIPPTHPVGFIGQSNGIVSRVFAAAESVKNNKQGGRQLGSQSNNNGWTQTRKKLLALGPMAHMSRAAFYLIFGWVKTPDIMLGRWHPNLH